MAKTKNTRSPAIRKALDKALAKMKKTGAKKPQAAQQGKQVDQKILAVPADKIVSATNLRGKIRMEETEEGHVLFNVPFPKYLAHLDELSPIIMKWHYETDYIHSYAQDSPFFAGLANKRLLGTRCDACKYTYATPKGHCMNCGRKTAWVELPQEGRVHSWTTCYFGSQEFLKETPFNLVLVEFEGAHTLFLSRLVGVGQDGIRVGMKIRAQFKRNSKFLASDVYFVPA